MNKLLYISALIGSAWALPLPGPTPHTQRQSDGNSIELWRSAQILGQAPLVFDFQHSDEMDSAILIHRNGPLRYSSAHDSIHATPLIGYEQRLNGLAEDHADAWDAGLRLWGYRGPLSFWADARIYTEFHSIANAPSYDREFVERQAEGTNGIQNTYISFARYRAAMELRGDYGRIGFRRDPVHWGPGTFYNLAFQGDAIPFAHLYYHGQIGPIRVTSLWGRLNIPGNKEFGYSDKSRSMYAHRYEWAPTANLSLGLSEQLVTYESEAFAALFPIVPLFMEKGQILEENNNGNISADFAYRIAHTAMIYGEFFLDDLQEPTSLFNDFWGNRWAAMAGLRLAHNLGKYPCSAVIEWSRVEPWVYAHYHPNTAQVSSRGFPLGNPLGPNSMGLKSFAQIRLPEQWEIGIGSEWTWKGTDRGSSQEDPISEPTDPDRKVFLAGVNGPEWTIRPSLGYKWKWIYGQAQFGFRDGPMDLMARMMVEY